MEIDYNMPKGWVETTLGLLPEDWIPVDAQSYCDKVADGTHDSPKKTEEGKLLITSKNIKDSRLDTKSAYNISYNDFIEINNRSKVDQWDVLLSMIGTVGEVCLIDKEPDFAIKNVGLFKCGNKTKAKWLYYFLKSKIGRHYIFSRLSGTTQKYITLGELRKLPIPNPPLPEQKAIAAVLSACDDKIELLREQNQTLETIAQTIFKEWFVNFNFPDKNGRPYRENGGEMVDSELGEIPKGWRVGNIGHVLTLLYGKALKTEDRTGSGFPVYGSNGIVGYHEKYLVEGPGVIVGRKGSMGKVVWSNSNFFPIDTTFYVSDMFNTTGLFFHYFLLKRYDFEKIGSDSAVPGLNRNAVYVIKLALPSLDIIEKFNIICKTIFKKIKNNTLQTQTLAQIRDTLLPKLMTGELRVAPYGRRSDL
ncbi:Restriction endonuclease type I, HsdS-like [Desulfonema limicola]|uniref:Restriction endonuclease type I, HsdS-like n=1 Tax=Desulfonema limicola TaxID=45656 RepID=A0A975BDR2_9BACT|nr:restriction endonuclease subunit S [Desulfonema limicola]QTA83453.1 Restriction endonuclease type I, HsdS-like [Desulfonema limicola]